MKRLRWVFVSKWSLFLKTEGLHFYNTKHEEEICDVRDCPVRRDKSAILVKSFKVCCSESATGQAREFWDALQRVYFRGPAEGFRSAVCLLGAGDDEWRTSRLEMPAGIHRNLWLYHRAIHRVNHTTFYRWESLLQKICDEWWRCVEPLRRQNMCLFLQTVMVGTRWRPRREDQSETCTSLASSLSLSAEDCCSYSLSTVSSHKRYQCFCFVDF